MKKIMALICVLGISCSASEKKVDKTVAAEQSQEEPKANATSEPMMGSESGQSADRISESTTRLVQTPGGKVILAAIEKAGGLEPWFSSPLHFRFNYVPIKGRPPIDTKIVVDTRAAKARHLVAGTADDFGKEGIEFGWTGTQAWSKGLPEDSKTNPRFWALTPYYFVGVPFVLADPGVVLTLEGEEEFEGKLCDIVRVTFEANVGDAPDDYYVVYVEKESKKVSALRYVVSYKGFFPDGGQSPEKIMVYSKPIEADGMTFATSYSTYKWDMEKKEKGELVTNISASEIGLVPAQEGFFEVPEAAKVMEGLK